MDTALVDFRMHSDSERSAQAHGVASVQMRRIAPQHDRATCKESDSIIWNLALAALAGPTLVSGGRRSNRLTMGP